MLLHKLVLKEIFEAEMEEGGVLYQKCDKVLTSSVRPLPSNEDISTFIMIGDFIVSDAAVGELKDKYIAMTQEILCGALLSKSTAEMEEDAEDKSYKLAQLVRTILKGNLKLISVSYPEGIAKRTKLFGIPLEFFEFFDVSCCVSTISLIIYMREAD